MSFCFYKSSFCVKNSSTNTNRSTYWGCTSKSSWLKNLSTKFKFFVFCGVCNFCVSSNFFTVYKINCWIRRFSVTISGLSSFGNGNIKNWFVCLISSCRVSDNLCLNPRSITSDNNRCIIIIILWGIDCFPIKSCLESYPIISVVNCYLTRHNYRTIFKNVFSMKFNLSLENRLELC